MESELDIELDPNQLVNVGPNFSPESEPSAQIAATPASDNSATMRQLPSPTLSKPSEPEKKVSRFKREKESTQPSSAPALSNRPRISSPLAASVSERSIARPSTSTLQQSTSTTPSGSLKRPSRFQSEKASKSSRSDILAATSTPIPTPIPVPSSHSPKPSQVPPKFTSQPVSLASASPIPSPFPQIDIVAAVAAEAASMQPNTTHVAPYYPPGGFTSVVLTPQDAARPTSSLPPTTPTTNKLAAKTRAPMGDRVVESSTSSRTDHDAASRGREKRVSRFLSERM